MLKLQTYLVFLRLCLQDMDTWRGFTEACTKHDSLVTNDLISQPQGILAAIPKKKMRDVDQPARPIVARFGDGTSA